MGVGSHGALQLQPDCLVSSGLICGGQLQGGSPEAKITNSAMSDEPIVVPWGAVRKDWKVTPESQLPSIIDVYPERREGGQSCGSHIFAVLVLVRSWTEGSGFCQNTACWVGEGSVDQGAEPQAG